MYVQLSEDKSEVVAVFASPQDKKAVKNQAKLPEDDERLVAFLEKMELIK